MFFFVFIILFIFGVFDLTTKMNDIRVKTMNIHEIGLICGIKTFKT